MQKEPKNLFTPQKGAELNFCKVCASCNLMFWQQPCKYCTQCSIYKEPEQTAAYHRKWYEVVGKNYVDVREAEQGRSEVDTIDTDANKINEDSSRPAQDVIDPRTGEPLCFV